jgi:hypothetical protein
MGKRTEIFLSCFDISGSGCFPAQFSSQPAGLSSKAATLTGTQ